VTARKDTYGEVVDWICNDCRFEKKQISDWIIEGPAHIDRHSVISANHYESLNQLKLDIAKQKNRGGKKPALGEGALNPNNI
jgi:NADH-quinone oxidoreductase subunit G